METCTLCWQGIYADGACNKCGYRRETESKRRTDALPSGYMLNNRYLIGAVLGKGGFGITYSCWDNHGRRRIALKELFPITSVIRSGNGVNIIINNGHEEYFNGVKSKFQNEANLLYRINTYCNIAQVYDMFECNGTVYYAMEFLQGCDLDVYRKQKGVLSWDFLRPIMKQLLQTLSVLHKNNIIHRDISPDNIFLLKDNTVKLIDFGAARTYQGKFNFTVLKKDGLSPYEQIISSAKQGPYTDIYALSATMYLLLSGKLPPAADQRKIGNQTLVPLQQYCPALPDYVAKAIEKGMNVDASDRFQSAEEYMRALNFFDTQEKTPPPVVIPLSGSVDYWIYGRSGMYTGMHRKLMKNKEITLGRLPSCDVVFSETAGGVSRRQCVLFVNNANAVYIKDAGSTYGTFLNNVRLGTTWTKINCGDIIKMGAESFELVCANT